MAACVRRLGVCGVLALAIGGSGVADAQSRTGPGECPQPRFTGKAPEQYYVLQNPLPATADHLSSAQRIYEGKAGRSNCAMCHGSKGDGKGPLATLYDPPPRNFACAQTVNGIPDGQLFWIVKYGSPGTGMPPHLELSEQQLWQLVLYLRKLAR
jgi:mono/diheme cytochrome c family protein